MYRWVEHTAEIELHVRAGSEADVFAEAARGLAELLGDDARGEERRVAVSLEASDRPALIADWLGELVYLAEAESFLPERVESLELADGSLRATVVGRRGVPRHLVKAVTYHGLELAVDGDAWRARVVLDV